MGDIDLETGHPVVHVRGAAERAVPVAADWAWFVESLADDESGAYLLSPNAERRTRYLARSTRAHTIGAFAPTPQRMRNTWLVDHLNAGTPLRTLMDAAGLTTSFAVVRLAPFLHQQSPAEQRTSLIHGGRAA